MPMFRKLATLATAAEAARRYAKKNPDKASKYVDQAAQFLDKQTKGKYSGQISGVASKAKGVAGIKPPPGSGATGNGYAPGATDLGSAPDYGQTKPTPGPAQH
jgi:alkylation response protein AidB-like acyl-CoA dehydrogenase